MPSLKNIESDLQEILIIDKNIYNQLKFGDNENKSVHDLVTIKAEEIFDPKYWT